MLRFSANLTLLFSELPFLDRFEAAAACGFSAVEILFPYDMAAQNLRTALRRNRLELVLINAPPPNYTGGEPGYAAIPGAEDRFRHDMRRVLRYAHLLKPGLIHVMAGYSDASGEMDSFVDNLRWVADTAPLQRFTIEPLSPIAQPGYARSDYDVAVEVLEQVDRSDPDGMRSGLRQFGRVRQPLVDPIVLSQGHASCHRKQNNHQKLSHAGLLLRGRVERESERSSLSCAFILVRL